VSLYRVHSVLKYRALTSSSERIPPKGPDRFTVGGVVEVFAKRITRLSISKRRFQPPTSQPNLVTLAG